MKNKQKLLKNKEKKQVESLEVLDPEKNQKQKSIKRLFPKGMRNVEIKNEIDEIKKWENKIKRKDLGNKYRKQIDMCMIFNNLKQ